MTNVTATADTLIADYSLRNFFLAGHCNLKLCSNCRSLCQRSNFRSLRTRVNRQPRYSVRYVRYRAVFFHL